MSRMRKRSVEGFDAFFAASVGKVLAVGRRLAGDDAVAEDLAAEAFVRAYVRWGSVRTHPNPEAWVLRTMANLAVDRSRKRQVVLRPEVAQSPDDAVVLHTTLVEALARLPRRQRSVVALRYLADLPEREVAEALAISTGSVKTHLSRGLAQLRVQLATPIEGDLT